MTATAATDCTTCDPTTCPTRRELEHQLAAARNALAAVREVREARAEGRL